MHCLRVLIHRLQHSQVQVLHEGNNTLMNDLKIKYLHLHPVGQIKYLHLLHLHPVGHQMQPHLPQS